ncbi:hypothetical protein B1F83_00865 [Chlamydia gallinacea]|nr:hypothetical protein B1F83_00865 [Chlamydia gallinacea]
MYTNISQNTALFPRRKDMKLRFNHLLLERDGLKVVSTRRQIAELVTAVLGVICFLVSVVAIFCWLPLSCGGWLLPTITVLGAAFLTFSCTSAYFRQEELVLDRRWRSYSLRCTELIADLQYLLQKKHK